MPPKKGKKKKKTKAEIEAERIAKEEEEERIRNEEEERRVVEEEKAKLALEENIRFRNEEVERFKTEFHQNVEYMTTRYEQHSRELTAESEKDEWDHFIRCQRDCWPDIDPVSLNTYITEAEEDVTNNIEDTLKYAENTHRIITHLESEFIENSVKGTQEPASKLNEFGPKLQEILNKKIHRVTEQILEQTTKIIDSPHNDFDEVLISKKGRNIALALLSNKRAFSTKKRLDILDVMGLILDIPESSSGNQIAVRLWRFNSDVMPLRRHTEEEILLGEVYHINLLYCPSTIKTIDSWTIGVDMPSSTEYENTQVADSSDHVSSSSPIECQLVVPDNIILAESPSIVCWEAEDTSWSTNAISECTYDTSSRRFNFSLSRPGIVGIVQSRAADLPYSNWTLGPLMVEDSSDCDLMHNSIVRLSITTPRFTVTIQVNGSTCTLVEPDIPPLRQLRSKSFRLPGDLLLELSKTGIHLLPTDEDVQRMNCTLKLNEIEERMLSDLSYLCPSYFAKSHRCSANLGQTKACYHIKESDAFTGSGCDPSPPYLALVELDSESASAKGAPGSDKLPASCGKVQCSILRECSGEEDTAATESLDFSPKEGTQSCLFMLNCILPLSTEEAKQRVEKSSPITTETMKQLLRLTRPFNFC